MGLNQFLLFGHQVFRRERILTTKMQELQGLLRSFQCFPGGTFEQRVASEVLRDREMYDMRMDFLGIPVIP